jgi:hypothetical protein
VDALTAARKVQMITPNIGKIAKSLRIVKALVAGVNPNSGGEIKQDSVFHDAERASSKGLYRRTRI